MSLRGGDGGSVLARGRASGRPGRAGRSRGQGQRRGGLGTEGELDEQQAKRRAQAALHRSSRRGSNQNLTTAPNGFMRSNKFNPKQFGNGAQPNGGFLAGSGKDWRNPTSAGYQKSMNDYYQTLKKRREQERVDAIKNGQIADPEVRTGLDKAITLVGTCQDMCPEFERVERIVQNMVDNCEKTTLDAAPKPLPFEERMVKRFRRSAAGYDEQLPSDVRPPPVLQRTLNYLLDEVVGGPQPLATVHKFVWDRTRSIRNDFSVQQLTKAEDLAIAIDCFERIARFHILALHQLSHPDHLDSEFSAQQEREQLDKTLLSLMYYYDDNRHKLPFPNEPEFRAYCIIFQIQSPTPDLEERAQEWPKEVFWHPRVQKALEIYAAATNSMDAYGPLRPAASAPVSQGNYSRFWAIVGSNGVSYLMACVAEIYFNLVRRIAITSMCRGFKRSGGSKMEDLTLDYLVSALGLDDDDQVEIFCEAHGLRIAERPDGARYLDIDSLSGALQDTFPPFKQMFSETLVESKRNGRLYPAVVNGVSVGEAINRGLIEESADEAEVSYVDDGKSLFITGHSDDEEENEVGGVDSSLGNDLSTKPTLNPTASPFSPFQHSKGDGTVSAGGFGQFKTFSSINNSAAKANPFGPPPSNASKPNPFALSGSTTPAPSNPFRKAPTSSSPSSAFGAPSFSSSTPSAPANTGSEAARPNPFAAASSAANKPNRPPTTTNAFGGPQKPLPSVFQPKAPSDAPSAAPQPAAKPPTFSFLSSTTTATQNANTTPAPPLSFFNKPAENTTQPSSEVKSSQQTPQTSFLQSQSTTDNKPTSIFGLKPNAESNSLPAADKPTSFFSKPAEPSTKPAFPTFSFSQASNPVQATQPEMKPSNESANESIEKAAPIFAAPASATKSEGIKSVFSQNSTDLPAAGPSLFGQKDKDVSKKVSFAPLPETSRVTTPQLSAPTVTPSQRSPSISPPSSQSSALAVVTPGSAISGFSKSATPASRAQSVENLSRTLYLENDGLLEQFMEYLIAPIVASAVEHVADEKAKVEADAFRRRKVSERYFYRWKEIAWKLGLKRKGRERRKQFAQSAMASMNKKRRVTEENMEEWVKRQRSSHSKLLADQKVVEKGPTGQTLTDQKRAVKRKSLPSDFQTADKEAIDTRSDFKNGSSQTHKRSKTVESSSLTSGSFKVSNNNRSLSRSTRDQPPGSPGAMESVLGRPFSNGTHRRDTTKSEYFRLKSMGVDPNAVLTPPKSYKTAHKRTRDEDDTPPPNKLAKRTPTDGSPALSQRQSTFSVSPPTLNGAVRPTADDDDDEALFAQLRGVREAMSTGITFFHDEMEKEGKRLRESTGSSRQSRNELAQEGRVSEAGSQMNTPDVRKGFWRPKDRPRTVFAQKSPAVNPSPRVPSQHWIGRPKEKVAEQRDCRQHAKEGEDVLSEVEDEPQDFEEDEEMSEDESASPEEEGDYYSDEGVSEQDYLEDEEGEDFDADEEEEEIRRFDPAAEARRQELVAKGSSAEDAIEL